MSLLDSIKGALGLGQAQAQPQAQQPEVDVDQVLADMASGKGMDDLNYDTSIVDLLKVLGLPSDQDARHELGTELGVQADPSDSAAYNQELHAKVLEHLKQSGGKVTF